ncbi:ComF family protein [Undibacterium jejuense]|uniref:ComF family protein n=2 Tax=Undibacterium jejuense TaxID=1344949 RepID=A0A923HPY7_9BURK|nr:ComF family protein [Undibacterium jejuense]
MNALLPCSCVLCHAHQSKILCTDCQTNYFRRATSRCKQCALTMPPGANTPRCGDCLQNPPSFDTSIVACDYAAPRDQMVLALKFGHQLALAPLFARMLRDAILQNTPDSLPDFLCAVPLGENRLRERGFNQATEIARPLAQHLGIPFAVQAMHRIRETSQQSSLTPDARVKNVKNAFMLDEAWLSKVKGAHIAIVDDVMTTGMTLHEIATMLKRFGAEKVTNYVFARTPPHFY